MQARLSRESAEAGNQRTEIAAMQNAYPRELSAANVRNHAPVSGHHRSGIIETHVRKQAPNVRKQAPNVRSAANVRNHAPVSGHHGSGIIETHVRKRAPNVSRMSGNRPGIPGNKARMSAYNAGRLRTSQLFVSRSAVLAIRASRPPALVLWVHAHSCL